ncbi:MAG: DNA mismatch repair protein MutS [Promethearchaeia archaeon]|nr:MAG: DNA mismatch repair protein MutS [Candidatus Lokiarchaeia archaeon]
MSTPKSSEDMTISAETLYKSGKMPDMMQHWYSIRKQYPEEFLLAYRMGDFYEFFYDDAIKVSKLLGLTLTKRGTGPSRHPLAGIPHKATQHFKNLVKQGQTVVIVEQLEDPKKATGKIVKRGVVRVLSPGTIVDDLLLESDKPNFICAIFRQKRNFGVALLDLSSGDFYTSEFYGKMADRVMWAWVNRFSPVECVVSDELAADFTFMENFHANTSMILKPHSSYHFLPEKAYKTLCKQFQVENLASFDLEQKILSICASGGLVSFIQETQKEETLANICKIKYYLDHDYMFLDATTQKNLELTRNQTDGGNFGTLFSILNRTQTPMGTRLLRQWIVQPLLSKTEIDRRLECVAFFISNYELLQEFRNLLHEVGDLSRIISRINYSSTVNARNLLNLAHGLKAVGEIQKLFSSVNNHLITDMISQLSDFSSMISLIEASIHPNPPTTITEGHIIRDGYNAQVDEYRQILRNGKQWVIAFENEEKRKLNLSTGLKIGYNRVLGYYIQITNNALKGLTLPPEYIQRQSLKSSVRFETERLKDMELKILSAEENLMDVEYELFQGIRDEVTQHTLQIQKNAEIIAVLDVLSCFADVALNYNYNRPNITLSDKIRINKGRHPIIEQVNTKERFVPNDCLLNSDSEQVLVITGPNWSGKSTYLRQTALIIILAQMGCFIPAESAEIGIVDRIFTRIGASDDLTRGQSTFMLEMNEMAQILNYATENSLVIIDELGRGTGTVDGQSIAQAVIEFLHEKHIRTLFSTHFHELINLDLPRMHNFHFRILEKTETRELVFLRQLTDGGTDKSYGIHVAMMAGMPPAVTDRAFHLMEEALKGENSPESKSSEFSSNLATKPTLNDSHPQKSQSSKSSSAKETISKIPHLGLSSKTISLRKARQTTLFAPPKIDDSELIIMLRSLDLNHMTPIEAFETLVKMKKKIQR